MVRFHEEKQATEEWYEVARSRAKVCLQLLIKVELLLVYWLLPVNVYSLEFIS